MYYLNMELARQIIQLARNTLFVNFRFMQRAVAHIEMTEYEPEYTDERNNVLWACDGMHLYYDESYVLARYKENTNLIAHSLLHSILHCVYHHDWIGRDVDMDLWNLATDIAVENTIAKMNNSCTAIPDTAAQKVLIRALEDELKFLNAESIYKWLKEHNVSSEEANKERIAFKMDQHSLWMNASEDSALDENIMRIWQDISKRMQMEIETMSIDQDVLCANLQRANRSRRSYAQFLKRFGNHGEIMRMSEDEFDNNYYAYGMELYGNIPLIEHLEYREQKHIKEFVIAIDTSGSVQGETVQKFVQHTYDLIKSQESFDLRTRLHIIQCDDRVREDAIISSDDEFEKYMSNMQILGLGETDFRPVFAYVDKLLSERKLTNLAGLLYYTDGQGIFPEKKPPYDVAFIIHSDEVYPPEVPSWAMRLILEATEYAGI